MTSLMQAMTLLLPPSYNFKEAQTVFPIPYNVPGILLNITMHH